MCSPDNTVKLNVGGTIFQSTHSTLTKFNGYFKTILETSLKYDQNVVKKIIKFNRVLFRMLMDKYSIMTMRLQVEKDKFGYIFIDRDPTHFRLILNFMRDGDVGLPDSKQVVDEILREANFYLLEGLMELCSRKLEVSEPKNVSKMRFLESDDDVLRAIAYPEQPVLIFYYTVDRYDFVLKPGEDIKIFEVLEEYETTFDIYFRKRKPDYANHQDGDWGFCIYYKNETIAKVALPKSSRELTTKIQKYIKDIERFKCSNN